MPLRQLRVKLIRRLRCFNARQRVLLVALIALPFFGLTLMWFDGHQSPVIPHQSHEGLQLQFDFVALRSHRQQSVRLAPSLEQLAADNSRYLRAGTLAGIISGHMPAQPCSDALTGNTNQRPPEDIEEPFTWQQVTPQNDEVYIFSAHLDLRWRPSPAVVIVGLSSEYSSRDCASKYCQIWYRNDVSGKPHVTPAYCRYSYETHGLRYAPAIYTCFVRDDQSVPYAVSIVNDSCATSSHNLLKVVTPFHYDRASSSPVNFTVCVTPFNFRYDNVRQLVEMIEVNRMYGAQQFIFYNYSSGPNVTRYLNDFYHKALDVATVIPWHLPMPVDVWPRDPNVHPQVHYFAQVAALNDCLYRCINRRSTFAVFTDLDEVIVPRRWDSWSAMLEGVTANWRGHNGRQFPGSYLFKNVFFRTDWTQDQTFVDRGDAYRSLITLSTTERELKVFEWMSRSKYIVWSNMTLMVGVHTVVETPPDVATVMVDSPDALLHHYRLWIDDPGNPPRRLVDRHMHQYADKIARRTAAVHDLMTTDSRDIAK